MTISVIKTAINMGPANLHHKERLYYCDILN